MVVFMQTVCTCNSVNDSDMKEVNSVHVPGIIILFFYCFYELSFNEGRNYIWITLRVKLLFMMLCFQIWFFSLWWIAFLTSSAHKFSSHLGKIDGCLKKTLHIYLSVILVLLVSWTLHIYLSSSVFIVSILKIRLSEIVLPVRYFFVIQIVWLPLLFL